MVTTLKSLSGLGAHWDDEKEMNIGLKEADAWNIYCTVRCVSIVAFFLLIQYLETQQSQGLHK